MKLLPILARLTAGVSLICATTALLLLPAVPLRAAACHAMQLAANASGASPGTAPCIRIPGEPGWLSIEVGVRAKSQPVNNQ